LFRYPEWLRPEMVSGLPFRWYGLMYVIAFAITYLLVRYQARKKWGDVNEDLISSVFFWGILGLFLGARLFGTLVYDTSGLYWREPWLILWPFDGAMRFVGFQGMSYHGGVIGLIVAFTAFGRRHDLDLLAWGDMIAAAAPLGYTFGRIGNFINGELYGRATASPLGMLFPNAMKLPLSDPRVADIAQAMGIGATESGLVNLPRFPSQLFEAATEGLLLWALLWFILRRKSVRKGTVLGAYIAGYGLIRFIIEYFREPDIDMGFPLALGDPSAPTYLFVSPFNFSMGQLFCLVMVFGSIIFLRVISRRGIEGGS
jgi:phosphatidylglycerol:prolipoprotein diacylglycerol transferase